jgi:hypothetical protein
MSTFHFHSAQRLPASARPVTCEQSLDVRFATLPGSGQGVQQAKLLKDLQLRKPTGLRSAATHFNSPSARPSSVVASLRGAGQFAGFAEISDDLNSAMSDVVNALRDAYAQGQKKIDDAHGTGFTDWATGTSAQSASVQSAYNRIGPLIDKLDGPLRQQVVDGHKPDGAAYALADWKSFAKDIGNDIKSQVGYSWDSSGLNVLQQTAVKSVADAKVLASFGLGTAALAAGAVGAVYLLVISGTGAQLLSKLFKKKSPAFAGRSRRKRR